MSIQFGWTTLENNNNKKCYSSLYLLEKRGISIFLFNSCLAQHKNPRTAHYRFGMLQCLPWKNYWRDQIQFLLKSNKIYMPDKCKNSFSVSFGEVHHCSVKCCPPGKERPFFLPRTYVSAGTCEGFRGSLGIRLRDLSCQNTVLLRWLLNAPKKNMLGICTCYNCCLYFFRCLRWSPVLQGGWRWWELTEALRELRASCSRGTRSGPRPVGSFLQEPPCLRRAKWWKPWDVDCVPRSVVSLYDSKEGLVSFTFISALLCDKRELPSLDAAGLAHGFAVFGWKIRMFRAFL